METTEQCWQALIDGKKLINDFNQEVVRLKNGKLINQAGNEVAYNFSDPRSMDIYREYFNIHKAIDLITGNQKIIIRRKGKPGHHISWTGNCDCNAFSTEDLKATDYYIVGTQEKTH